MARLKYIPDFLGTRDGLVFYTRWGNFYVRTQSTLTREAVLTRPSYAPTRYHASILKRAARVASAVYRKMRDPAYSRYRQLVGDAIRLLRTGMEDAEALERLLIRNLSELVRSLVPYSVKRSMLTPPERRFAPVPLSPLPVDSIFPVSSAVFAGPPSFPSDA